MATVEFKKVNSGAVAAPTATDDSTLGYSKGSVWMHGADVYFCVDPTEDAAEWDLVASGGLAAKITTLPLAAISAAHTFALGESGGRHPAADTTARTWTIPANSSVAFPVNTVLTIINEFAAGAITLAITSDTLTFLDDNDNGSRTIGPGGVATVLKTGSTSWLVWGKEVS